MVFIFNIVDDYKEKEWQKMIKYPIYKTCKDCPYYYGEINQCMYGEEGVPDDLEKKCEVKKEQDK